MKPAIHANDLAKRYLIGQNAVNTTLAEALSSAARSILRGATGPQDRRIASNLEFWALKGISFTVDPGEVVGIVGENGAGKSTLLKILSRITLPTRGSITYRGRIGSLLEVGTGFHPELSGRDNIYLSGAILGMSRSEIKQRFDEILDFSEVETFIDTPVKRYSSGMYMRLAFAVAAHLDTDILLVDEVLAVGDYKFQQKCLSRMNTIANDGRTVVFVSHNLIAIQAICDRAIWLDQGMISKDGRTHEVLAAYTRSEHAGSGVERSWPDPANAPGNDSIRLRYALVQPLGGAPGDAIDVRQAFALSFEYESHLAGAHLNVSACVYSGDGALVFHAGPTEEPSAMPSGRYRDRCIVPGDLMNDGNYRVSLEIRDRGELLLTVSDLLTFEILDVPDGRFGWFGKWDGVVRPRLDWTTEHLPAA
ncbi:MAG TPA: polysaccharide ABC transporter ATP-binding protein [Hyphomicrobiaceae bacterium]|nr:polysaccharide ABC transporter ATP-binding protein [Hyphomicrobiaceae bacterium]